MKRWARCQVTLVELGSLSRECVLQFVMYVCSSKINIVTLMEVIDNTKYNLY